MTAERSSSQRTPSETVLAIWDRIFNGHDLSAADELVAEDYRQNTEGVAGGRDGFKKTFAMYLAMSPDLRVEPKAVQEIDDIVVIRGTVFMGNPPPGVTSPIEVVDIFRVADGMVQEHWEV
ncbi:ester cyclase [Breoghania sp. L-A4]|uniref:nuclear transport factor 2 family protein n=1 Tax=Breoghania sp. L-A4 TaxID=2304600 RepID=UPI000E35D6C7|nr:ester cyclase [Breoghania sp. L-A4]AXS40795.1 hypothetical protein D1F64_12970 [Breoghania sp. L-A4]